MLDALLVVAALAASLATAFLLQKVCLKVWFRLMDRRE